MKIFKTILKTIGILLGIIFLIIGGFIVYASIDKTDSFYIRDAELKNSEFLLEVDNELKKGDRLKILHEKPSVYAHRIKEGKGIIFGYRWYTAGSLLAIDDEGFEKLTVWISPNQFSKHAIFNLRDFNKIIVVYTKGGSAWPASACSGYIKSGSVEIIQDGKSYKVILDGIMKPQGVRTLGDWCKTKILKMVFISKEIEHSELTAWLGKASDHPYNETYR